MFFVEVDRCIFTQIGRLAMSAQKSDHGVAEVQVFYRSRLPFHRIVLSSDCVL